MNHNEYDERTQFWADLLMGLVIVGFATAGFVFGAWFAVESIVKEAVK